MHYSGFGIKLKYEDYTCSDPIPTLFEIAHSDERKKKRSDAVGKLKIFNTGQIHHV